MLASSIASDNTVQPPDPRFHLRTSKQRSCFQHKKNDSIRNQEKEERKKTLQDRKLTEASEDSSVDSSDEGLIGVVVVPVVSTIGLGGMFSS